MEIFVGETSRLLQLQAWLEDGWSIEEPILQRSVYHRLYGRVCAYEVVVHQRDERRVIALRDKPGVQHWLCEHRLAVLDVA